MVGSKTNGGLRKSASLVRHQAKMLAKKDGQLKDTIQFFQDYFLTYQHKFVSWRLNIGI